MITELFIQNVAVIEKLNIDFKSGMSVLTGETGAGKSIIIDSINMLLGNRADKELVRFGEEKAQVQAIFEVTENIAKILSDKDIECEDNQLIIARTISKEGKSVCRINGMAQPLSVLREIAPFIINIHGQLDNQALLTPSKHIDFLDAYAGDEKELLEYKSLYRDLKRAEEELSLLFMDDDERLRRADLLEYQVKEIEAAELKENEEDELLEQRDFILNAENIITSASAVKAALYSDDKTNAYDAICSAVSSLEKITGIDERIDKAYEALSDMQYTVQDIALEISDFAQNAEYNEEALGEIEERLDLYSKLKRKYGKTVLEINEYFEKASAELLTLKSVDENIDRVKARIEVLTEKITKSAKKLTDIRKKSAKALQEKIEKALCELNMDKARFIVNVDRADGFTPNGEDLVEFMISANAGEPEKPLVKIASGGELSRVMLAIKSILAECDGVDTLIFDEIDTGVSGNAAQKIADKLSKISRFRQVICITHLPQLASMADNHYFIQKNTEDDKTKTTVSLLDFDSRVEEIARITGGELTDISKEHARELLREADMRKCDKQEQ